jgi:hypothetical protein
LTPIAVPGSAACRRLVVALALGLGVLFLHAAPALSYTFNEPSVRATGEAKVVMDWATQSCDAEDIPDNPARAFRDSLGRVQLIASHLTTWRMMGSSIDTLTQRCDHTLFGSDGNQNPSAYNDKEWIGSLYTLNGQTVYALVSNEYQGWRYPTRCNLGSGWEQEQKCWENSITLAKSVNSGDSYSHAAPPGHLVAASPYQYRAGDGPYGYFAPSNIVRRADSYYYALVKTETVRDQVFGACLIRTNNLEDASSWRAWDGSGFNTRFINPYVETNAPASAHVCNPVARDQIEKMSSSLTYSTYFNRYVLVGYQAPVVNGQEVPGFYYSLSSDLVHWTNRKLLMKGELPWTHQCGEEDPILNPSLIDPNSTSANFETIGQRAYLYFTQYNYEYVPGECYMSLDRDLVRIPIEFSDAAGPGPGPDPAPAPAPAPAPQPARSSPPATSSPDPATTTAAANPRCTTARNKRKQLMRLVRTTQRKLSKARTVRAKRRYRRQLAKHKRRLAQARRSVNVTCGTAQPAAR